jgi:NADPH:quinone reductase-like Zn-dependent oxidoreductase
MLHCREGAKSPVNHPEIAMALLTRMDTSDAHAEGSGHDRRHLAAFPRPESDNFYREIIMSNTKSGTVLLAGAAGGLGQAIARAITAAGRRVVLVDRNEDSLCSDRRDHDAACQPILKFTEPRRRQDAAEAVSQYIDDARRIVLRS